MTAADDTAIDTERYRMQVTVESEYLPDQSDEDGQRWVFAYHIRILNRGAVTARLLTRHWVITDGDERVQEVHGEGVIGEQPHIAPGQTFRYTSGAPLSTPSGFMSGSYEMRREGGDSFAAIIPDFPLDRPYDRLSLH